MTCVYIYPKHNICLPWPNIHNMINNWLHKAMYRPKWTPSDSLRFQLLHAEVRDATPLDVNATHLDALLLADDVYEDLVVNAATDEPSTETTGILYGVSEEGCSVVVLVKQFKPSFFVLMADSANAIHAEQLAREVERASRLRRGSVSAKIVKKHKLYGWCSDSQQPLKRKLYTWGRLFFQTCKAARNAAFSLEKNEVDPQDGMGLRRLMLANNKVDVTQQLFEHCKIRASGWCQVTNFQLASQYERCAPFVQVEVRCDVGDIGPRDDIQKISRLLITCTDIETDSSTGAMSHALCSKSCAPGCTGDSVIFIGVSVYAYGDSTKFKPIARYMLCLGQVAPVEDMIVKCYPDEFELLKAWRDLVVSIDCDWETSYNGTGFDYKYLSDRHERVRNCRSSRFLHLGKLVGDACPIQERRLQSAAYGDNVLHFFHMRGRVCTDLFLYAKTNFKLSLFKLDAVAKEFIKDTSGKVVLEVEGWIERATSQARNAVVELVGKHHPAALAMAHALDLATSKARRTDDDCTDTVLLLEEDEDEAEGKEHPAWSKIQVAVNLLQSIDGDAALIERTRAALRHALVATGSDNYKKLFAINRMGPTERSAIAKYAMVDCDLALELMVTVNVVPNMVQMSNVTHTPLHDIGNRGQQIKVYNQLYRYSAPLNFVMNPPDCGWPEDLEYEGAFVIPPIKGYYTDPVTCLDFASLYPSIMLYKNLCMSTLCIEPPPTELQGTETHMIGDTPWTFVTHEKGVLPQILDSLLLARKQTRLQQKTVDKKALEWFLLEGRQLALKVSANSCYGFTGVQKNGMYACMPVAATVTNTGRGMIKKTKEFVEQNGATVIYGDTDSIMFTIQGQTLEEAFVTGPKLAKGATGLFSVSGAGPVKLEFEKVMMPYLLIMKKNYAAVKYESLEGKPKMDSKGLANVRRDNAALVRNVMNGVLKAVMVEKNPQKAYTIVSTALTQMERNEIPMDDLTITMSLKSEDSYVDPSAHAQITVVRNMVKRGAFDVPRAGDRVPFVIVESKESKISQRAEQPSYAQANAIPLDRVYYTNSMRTPVLKIMDVLPVPPVDELFSRTIAELERQRAGMAQLTDFFDMAPAPPPKLDRPESIKRMTSAQYSADLKRRKVAKNMVEEDSCTLFD